jgi:hypothetical protein
MITVIMLYRFAHVVEGPGRNHREVITDVREVLSLEHSTEGMKIGAGQEVSGTQATTLRTPTTGPGTPTASCGGEHGRGERRRRRAAHRD